VDTRPVSGKTGETDETRDGGGLATSRQRRPGG
jgi:hypothetical protein